MARVRVRVKVSNDIGGCLDGILIDCVCCLGWIGKRSAL